MPLHFRAPRGTRDLLPGDRPYWDRVEQVAESLAQRYDFRRIDTPTFEDIGLFLRSVGEETDIAEKEIYAVRRHAPDLDSDEEAALSLRPEGTAPVIRAYLEHGMHTLPQPVKLYYVTSIFRHDRPQAGRYREHRQFGVEAIGEVDPALDAEVITLAWEFYAALGISNVNLQLNSVGCSACRPVYLKELNKYLSDFEKDLCGICRNRFLTNPLRILDCKEEGCQEILGGAPMITEFLCEECQSHVGAVKDHIRDLEMSFTLNPRLVRGLDYYTKTVFEYWMEGIGAQNAIGAGGRYDGLAETLGGPRSPGIGFGIGLDRVILSMQEQGTPISDEIRPEVFLVSLGERARKKAPALLRRLRKEGYRVAASYGSRSMRSQMRQANGSGAAYGLILGDTELEKGQIACREMASGDQTEFPLDELVTRLTNLAGRSAASQST